MSTQIIILVILVLGLDVYNCQYGNYGPVNNIQQSDKYAPANDVEQKYVNSGQSVLLVCDLPNNMPDGKVLFVKYESKVLSSGLNIIDEIEDERFEIGQQYAWEWSLKINSINEEDAGVYFCKVGLTTIKQYEIIVRVPPRIRDEGQVYAKSVKEGGSVQFSCFANGTPKPNITWSVISPLDQTVTILKETGSYLNLEGVSRSSPRFYQCKASNYIPPSDTRNFTLSIEFAPEITIESRLDEARSVMELNCTIRAYPLTNRHFWRKDGSVIQNSIKTEIRNSRLNDHTLVSHLTIKYYNEMDQGLYECAAENDLRVSKIFYTLKDLHQASNKLMPIGYSNNYRGHLNPPAVQENNLSQELDTTTRPHRRKFKHKSSASLAYSSLNHDDRVVDLGENDFGEDKMQRKQLRNRKIKKLKQQSSLQTTTHMYDTTNEYNSPYIILLDEYTDEKKLMPSGSDKPKSIVQNSAASLSYFFNLKILHIVCIYLFSYWV